jgi:hypothetical protein
MSALLEGVIVHISLASDDRAKGFRRNATLQNLEPMNTVARGTGDEAVAMSLVDAAEFTARFSASQS